MAEWLLLLVLLLVVVALLWKGRRRRRRARRRGQLSSSSDTPSSLDYALRRDWSRREGILNYSSFVFFDVDRDGTYGIGDRPMGGIRVRLSGERGFLFSSRTNGNGFANFTTGLGGKVAIRQPGLYTFTVSVPPGWTVTTGNDLQTKDFIRIEGSSSGLGTEEMVRPVGLAPERILRGRLPDGVAVTVATFQGDREFGSDTLRGSFQYRVPDNADTVRLRGEGIDRVVRVGTYPVDVGLLEPTMALSPISGTPVIIPFDDVTPRGLRKIPSGYGGLNWFNLNVVSRDFQGGSQGYVNGNTSGDHMAYTSSGHPAEFWSDMPFDFIGVMLSAAWLDSEGETGIIECWRGEERVRRDTVELSALTPVHYMPMLPKLTRVRLSTAHYWQMVVDDLTIVP